MKWRVFFASTVMGLASSGALAVDGISIEVGYGDGVDMARLGLQWNWDRQWFKEGTWLVSGYWNAAIGQWKTDALPGQNSSITEIGLTPTFRLRHASGKGVFAEAGIGAHLLSESTINSRYFGSTFQFGSHLGAGYRFGEKRTFELGLRVQHLSNAGIKRPNDGINFSQVRMQYQF
jgi:lipid A 3-O-deacylase